MGASISNPTTRSKKPKIPSLSIRYPPRPIRAAISRASLGQDTTLEEIEFDRLAGIQTAQGEAALQTASNPDLSLAKMEQAALSSDAPLQ